jgi:2-dehydro-3-deoxyphosphogluconate aldolase/(4S)-4-hydroxy-2-oxoglutarate aldolase
VLSEQQARESVDAGARFLVSPGTDAAYLRSLRGPFPDVAFVPTGGVNSENLAEWFTAGAIAVGAGGELCPVAAMASGRWEEITAIATRYAAALRPVRGVHS